MNKFFLFLFLAFFLFACKNQTEEKTTQASTEMVLQKTPVFNPDSAYSFVEKQVSFGARVPNTLPHQKCGDFLVQKLKEMGLEVTEQKFEPTTFSGAKLQARNMIGSYRSELSKRILLAAHWDTRPFADQEKEPQKQTQAILGASDGASGVGILLEVLRTIQADSNRLNVGVDVIFFDAEDYGQPDDIAKQNYQEDMWCLGSQYWSKNKHKGNYVAYFGILLDMVGAKDAQFHKEGTSVHFAPSVVDKVWVTAQKAGFGNYFINKNSNAITDDHAYVNSVAKIPMVDIIQQVPAADGFHFGSYWHTQSDNMDIIDRNTLKAVGQVVLQVLYNEQVTVQ